MRFNAKHSSTLAHFLFMAALRPAKTRQAGHQVMGTSRVVERKVKVSTVPKLRAGSPDIHRQKTQHRCLPNLQLLKLMTPRYQSHLGKFSKDSFLGPSQTDQICISKSGT